jgi:glycosyl transferase family 25
LRAWYINLASRPDRRDATERQLAGLGIEGERVDAVLFDDLPPDLQTRYAEISGTARLGRREFANAVSHLDAYGRFLATDERYALILEDDIILSTALPALLARIEARPETIDLLRLETFGNPQQLSTRPLETIGDYGLHTLHGWAWGAAAYVISRDAARRLCEHPLTLAGVIDRVLYRPHRTHIEPLIRRQLLPALAIQDDRLPGREWGGDSDIKATRTAMMAAPKPGWRLRIAEFVENELRIGLPSTIHRLLGRSVKRDVPFRPE